MENEQDPPGIPPDDSRENLDDVTPAGDETAASDSIHPEEEEEPVADRPGNTPDSASGSPEVEVPPVVTEEEEVEEEVTVQEPVTIAVHEPASSANGGDVNATTPEPATRTRRHKFGHRR